MAVWDGSETKQEKGITRIIERRSCFAPGVAIHSTVCRSDLVAQLLSIVEQGPFCHCTLPCLKYAGHTKLHHFLPLFCYSPSAVYHAPNIVYGRLETKYIVHLSTCRFPSPM